MFELGSMNLEIRFLDSFFRFESFVGHGLLMTPKMFLIIHKTVNYITYKDVYISRREICSVLVQRQ